MDKQNLPKTSHYLGIDFGTSKIGLALGDSELKIAFAYKTLENDEKLITILKQIVESEEISKLIIGELGNTSDFKTSFDPREIGEKISKELNLPVEYQEEMFSTEMAQKNIKERGSKGIKEFDNQEAARIILQSWLDKLD